MRPRSSFRACCGLTLAFLMLVAVAADCGGTTSGTEPIPGAGGHSYAGGSGTGGDADSGGSADSLPDAGEEPKDVLSEGAGGSVGDGAPEADYDTAIEGSLEADTTWEADTDVAGEGSTESASDAETGACNSFVDQGYCFEHTPTCQNDGDCDASFNGCDEVLGRCRAWFTCACATEGDCPGDAVCLRNERVCGECRARKSQCSTPLDCPTGELCAGGQCEEQCCQ